MDNAKERYYKGGADQQQCCLDPIDPESNRSNYEPVSQY